MNSFVLFCQEYIGQRALLVVIVLQALPSAIFAKHAIGTFPSGFVLIEQVVAVDELRVHHQLLHSNSVSRTRRFEAIFLSFGHDSSLG